MKDGPPPPPQAPANPATIKVLAGNLRREYIEKMRQLTGNKTYKPKTKDNEPAVWEKVAAVCHRLNARFDSFLQAQFEETKNKGGPYVNQLTGDYAASCYLTYKNRCQGPAMEAGPTATAPTEPPDFTIPADRDLELSLASIADQCMKAAGTCNPLDPKVQAIFFHEYSGIPPVLRCALCGDDPEVFRKYGKQARAALEGDSPMQNAMRVLGLPVHEILNYQSND
jgi:hypothetical protein